MWSFIVTAPGEVQEQATASFLSVVAYNPKKDRSIPDDQKVTLVVGTHLLVRARVKAHLEPLLPYAEGQDIKDDGHADYRWRLTVRREQYKAFMLDRIDDITYDSHFKEAFRDHARKDEQQALYSSLMSVWSIMNGHQRRKYTSSYKSWGKGSGSSYKGSSGTSNYVDTELWDTAADEWLGKSSYSSSKKSGGGYPWDKHKDSSPYTPAGSSLDDRLAEEEPDLDKVLDNLPKFHEPSTTTYFEDVPWPPSWSEDDKDEAYFPLHQNFTVDVDGILRFLHEHTAWSIQPTMLGKCTVDAWEIWRAAALLTPEVIPDLARMDQILEEAGLMAWVDLMEKIWVPPVNDNSTTVAESKSTEGV
jgi:hypothetical protein